MDALNLRRAGLMGLLRDWASMHHVILRESDPDQLDEDEGRYHYALCIVVLGSLAVNDRKATEWISHLTASHPDSPLVIISDRTEPEEAVSAFRLGARGFLPTTTPPDVAMHALSFIMGGGTFFPPGALMASGARPGGGRRPPAKRRPSSKGESDSQGDLRPMQALNVQDQVRAGEEPERRAHAIIGLDLWQIRRAGMAGEPSRIPGRQSSRDAAILLFRPSDRTRS